MGGRLGDCGGYPWGSVQLGLAGKRGHVASNRIAAGPVDSGGKQTWAGQAMITV